MTLLSEYMRAAAERDLPADAAEQAKHHLLDTLAAMISGSELLPGRAALRYIGSHAGKGSATIVGTPLTAGLRNFGRGQAHLLLFAVDARGSVHWIAPEFTVPGSNPQATIVPPSAGERLLPSSVVFDDLAPGPLRIVAVIASEPLRVLEVDTLSGGELESERLMKRFPRAEIRQFQLEVEP